MKGRHIFVIVALLALLHWRDFELLVELVFGQSGWRQVGASGGVQKTVDMELVLPTTLFDERYELDLDGTPVHLIYVGPCHQVGDTIVHLPEEGVVFAGDVVFRLCTPMGWTGSYEKWLQCLDLITELNPTVIVPGHGPACELEGISEMKAYLQYVRDESRKCFEEGLTSLDAAKRIEFGPYGEWRAPARLYMNVERAYREFRNEPPDAPWDAARTFDVIYKVAKAKGIEVEY